MFARDDSAAETSPVDDGLGAAARDWDDTMGEPVVFDVWLGQQIAAASTQAAADMHLVSVRALRELKAKVAILVELPQGERWVCTTCRAGAEWARELGVPYLDPGEYEAIVAAAEQTRVWPSDAAEWHAAKVRDPRWKISERTAGVLPHHDAQGWNWARLVWSFDGRIVEVQLYD